MSLSSKSNKTTSAPPAVEKEDVPKDKGPDVKGLIEELEGKKDKDGKITGGRNISFASFANADENTRKRALKDAYSELKTKYGWKYDQPIREEE